MLFTTSLVGDQSSTRIEAPHDLDQPAREESTHYLHRHLPRAPWATDQLGTLPIPERLATG